MLQLGTPARVCVHRARRVKVAKGRSSESINAGFALARAIAAWTARSAPEPGQTLLCAHSLSPLSLPLALALFLASPACQCIRQSCCCANVSVSAAVQLKARHLHRGAPFGTTVRGREPQAAQHMGTGASRGMTAGTALCFLHLFCGPRDKLGEALVAAAATSGLEVTVESYDLCKGDDLADPNLVREILEKAEAGRYHGAHSGFPCTTTGAVQAAHLRPPVEHQGAAGRSRQRHVVGGHHHPHPGGRGEEPS